MKINRNDLADLVATYQTICESGTAGTSTYIRHSDQEEPVQRADGSVTARYKTVQPGMGKKDKLSDATMQAALAILHQYAQGDISNVEAAEMFEDLYKKGAGNGPTQDDQYYTKLS